MRFARIPAALALLGFSSLQAGVIVNEILYHAPEDNDALQFIELHNPDKDPVSLRGWKFTQGIQLSLPDEERANTSNNDESRANRIG